MDSIGLRIKHLRKEQKLTLEALAGKKLTKGMLSLIENGKAKPSMESLSYIAQQLGVESSELMEDVSQAEKRNVLERVEKLYKVEFSELTNEYKQIIDLISPIVDKLTLSYESARLLEIYSRCSHHLYLDGWEVHYNQAMELYEQLHLYNQSASLALFKGMILYNQHRYDEALAIVLEEHARFSSPTIKLDAMTTLDYMYAELILYSAVGNNELTRLKMNEAMQFSKEERIFYRIDDLYRLACYQSIINENEEDRVYYLQKIRQYGEFAENKSSLSIAAMLDAHFYNSFLHDYQKAFESAELFLELSIEVDSEKIKKDVRNQYLLEKGKALFGLGSVKEALALLEDYIVPSYLHHPYDLSISYEVHAYRALCYSRLGEIDEALREAKVGSVLISSMPDSPYKLFINQTLEQIQKSSDSI
ncbi:helix-turn-helix domain-containing protein [Paenisporosarcina antarctica]|uniref:XRE family transcriptional regulator n=1 Tax=Paenisporosarcina antarctica TaxID=417367 RepID=A0A4P6ZVJ8_9BACL|nr:helix-turn-helix transcriptional regulator [Paenisporosarcina antarctica]QBP40028.1 XRE family transcriptional regulator [Paenisporosarcina antarctica]